MILIKLLIVIVITILLFWLSLQVLEKWNIIAFLLVFVITMYVSSNLWTGVFFDIFGK